MSQRSFFVVMIFLMLFLAGSAYAENRYYLPQVANGDFGVVSYRTTFILVNNSDAVVDTTLSLTDNSGHPLHVAIGGLGSGSTFNIRLDAGATAMHQTDGTGTGNVGAATVISSFAISVSAIFTLYDPGGRYMTEAGVASSAPAKEFVLPVDSTESFLTGLALFNPGADASITMNLVRSDGSPADQTTMELKSGTHEAFFVAAAGQLFPNFSNFRGTLVVRSPVPVAALVLRQYQKATLLAYTSLPVVPRSAPKVTHNLAHAANGSYGSISFKTSFLINNISSGPANVVLALTKDDGSPLTVTIPGSGPGTGTGSSFSFSLAPDVSVFLQTDGLGAGSSGAATITSDVPLVASGIFTVLNSQGQFQTEAGVGDSPVLAALTLPVDITGTFNTGVAFFNPGDAPITLTLRLLDAGGTIVSTTTRPPLGPKNHLAVFVDQLFPGTSNFRGSLSISARGGIAATTLRQNSTDPDHVSYTTLPAIPGTTKRIISLDPPVLAAPPAPASPTGTPPEKAIAFADLLASGDKDQRLAAWLGIYDALGVPVIGQDGKQMGSTGDDPVGPRYWQVWYASGLDLPRRGTPMSDAGRLIAAGLPGADAAAFGPMFLDDLRTDSQSTDPQVLLMSRFVRERVLRGASHVDIMDPAVTSDLAVIDAPTVQLLSWIMLRGGLFQAASEPGTSGASMNQRFQKQSKLLAQQPHLQLGPQFNCSDLPGAGSDGAYWANWLINKVGGGFELPGMKDPFPSLMERVFGKALAGTSADRAERITGIAGKALGWANIFTSSLNFYLQLVAMQINPGMDPYPLERTKGTYYPGNNGALLLQLYSDSNKIPNGDELESCLASFVWNALGVSFSFPPQAPIVGAEVKVQGGMGFPDLVMFNIDGEKGRAQNQRKDTDGKGFVEFKIFGAPQKQEIPQNAPPVEKEFSVVIEAQPEEAGLNSMANIFFGGLGIMTGGAAFLSTTIDMLKTFTYDVGEYNFPITDWGQGYRVDKRGFFGTICPGLHQPFTVTLEAIVGIVEIKGKMTFTPSNIGSGTWTFSGTGDGTTSVSATGSYTIKVTTTHSEIVIAPGHIWTFCGPDYGCISGGDAAEWTIPLIPFTCPQQGDSGSAGVSPPQFKLPAELAHLMGAAALSAPNEKRELQEGQAASFCHPPPGHAPLSAVPSTSDKTQHAYPVASARH